MSTVSVVWHPINPGDPMPDHPVIFTNNLHAYQRSFVEGKYEESKYMSHIWVGVIREEVYEEYREDAGTPVIRARPGNRHIIRLHITDPTPFESYHCISSIHYYAELPFADLAKINTYAITRPVLRDDGLYVSLHPS